jgi:small-conductance mechanosensitive channel
MGAIIRAYLPHIVGIALLALAGIAGWQYLAGQGYRLQALTLEARVEQIQRELSECKATAASRLTQIEAQNTAVEEARAEGEARRQAALAARDGALAKLEDTQARYDRLRQSWPSGCVEAVARVRQEYGL